VWRVTGSAERRSGIHGVKKEGGGGSHVLWGGRFSEDGSPSILSPGI